MLTAQLKHAGTLLCVLFSFNVFASDVAIVTLENGAQVRLKDDFTWEYILTLSPETAESITIPDAPTSAQNVKEPLALATPIAAPTSPAIEKAAPPAMNTNSLLQLGLLASAAKDGVKVSYTDAIWRDDELGLNFELSSTNSDGVVIVEVEVTFYDDNGQQFEQQTMRAWLASFRQPDTYLRKGQTRKSRTVWLEGVDKQRWNKKMLSLRVIEVDTR